jgi:nucleotide-binding universal stress UspA family protein
MSVRVLGQQEMNHYRRDEHETLFLPESDEVKSLGYPMKKELLFDTPSSGLVSAVRDNNAHAVVLGYPVGSNPRNFHRVLDTVAANVRCPLIAVRFIGTFKPDRILVPFLSLDELEELLPILEAMVTVALPRITFLQLLDFDSRKKELRGLETELQDWLADHFFDIQTRHMVEAAESRLESILQEARYHDLVIMTAAKCFGFRKLFFGSLSDSVVRNCRHPVIVVYTPRQYEQ